jgi:RNA polymerase primary sigma factor
MAAGGNRFHVVEGSLGIYLRDISRHKALSAAEECEYAVRIRKGDAKALEKLIKANLRFVVSVARNYQNQGLPLCDLINEGNLGLIRAARRFDEKKNFKFISYAVWWIRQSILQGLAKQSRIVKVPLNQVGTIHRIGKTRAKLEQKLHRPPNTREVAEELGIPEEDVHHTYKIGNTHTSLDAPVMHDSDARLVDILADKEQQNPEEIILENSLREAIDKSLSMLNWRERSVIKMYYGIGEETAYTLEEIGSQVNITRERVRQIKERALEKLKHAKKRESLRRCLALIE